MITFEKFLAKCQKDAEVYVTDYKKRKNVIVATWSLGGMTGASCYDTSEKPARMRSLSVEIEPEFECLDRILELFCPEITFIQYKTLVSKVIERFEEGSSDFYGNTDKTGVKVIDMRRLYDRLIEKGFLK